jgi:hypothetical protein
MMTMISSLLPSLILLLLLLLLLSLARRRTPSSVFVTHTNLLSPLLHHQHRC